MIHGSCLCGAVGFEVAEFCSGVFKCHCSVCRKTFGGASSAVVLAGELHFAWLQGIDTARRFQLHEGYSTCFCATCGSLLPQHLNSLGLYWIPAGLLDGDPGLVLERHVHVDSRAAWEVLDSHTEQLPGSFTLPGTGTAEAHR